MEWLEGEDLGRRLRRGALSVGEIVDLVVQVAEALEFAHSKGVVHRDIKPGNIFLHRQTIAKLLDFGIARKLSGTHLTRTGMVVGTVEYMAPEQVRASRDSGPGADIYALGCVLYECLSGDPPFSGNHIAAILARILFEEPHPLALVNPSLPSPLTSLVESMLQKDAAKRPLTAGGNASSPPPTHRFTDAARRKWERCAVPQDRDDNGRDPDADGGTRFSRSLGQCRPR